MNDETKREVPGSQGSVISADRFAKVLPSRRRLIAGGLVAAPIVASIQSRKALAADCLTPSGNLSGNVSTGAQVGTCTGKSAYYWSHLGGGQWPGGSSTANGSFHPAFASGPIANLGSDSMKQVVDYYSNATEAKWLAAYIVAAYLNVLAGYISIPGFDQTALVNLVKGIWGDYALYGVYKVNPTVSWDASKIKTYLTSNGIVG